MADGATEVAEVELQQIFDDNCRQESEWAHLFLDKHARFLERSLAGFAASYTGLDASQPWLIYWTLNMIHILDQQSQLLSISSGKVDMLVRRLMSFSNGDTSGGFGGGQGQISHLAPTFSAVQSLVLLGQFDLLLDIRMQLLRFIMKCKNVDGSFVMHDMGEVDLRASYCAIVVAKYCGLLNDSDLSADIIQNVAEFIGKCQTYEGGFGAMPGCEAHGGYTFCGFAALVLLNRFDTVDLQALERWTISRIAEQGGFAGRSNKLVDSCYCYWIYALVPLLQYAKKRMDISPKGDDDDYEIVDREHLLRYLLGFSQSRYGGFADRYPNGADYYHSCYASCAAALATYSIALDTDDYTRLQRCEKSVLNVEGIVPVHPLFGIPVSIVSAHFSRNVHKNQ